MNWKQIRDKWLEYMVAFKKLGDTEKANECLNMAVKATILRTEIEPVELNLKEE